MITPFLQSLTIRLALAAVNLCILVFTAKYLGVGSRGDIGLFLLNLSLIQGFCEIYTGYSLIHFIPRFSSKKLYSYGLTFVLMIASLFSILFWITGKQVQSFEWEGYVLGILVTLNTFHCVFILGAGKVALYNLLCLLQPLLLFLGVLVGVFYFHNFTFRSYVYPLLFSFSLSTPFTFFLMRRNLPVLTNKENFSASAIFLNGAAGQTAQVIFLFINKFCYYLFASGTMVGIYSAATILTESVLLPLSAIIPFLIAYFAKTKPDATVYRNTITLCGLTGVYCLFALFLLLWMPETWYLKILGAGFLGIKKLMIYYGPSIVPMAFYLILSAFFSARGQSSTLLKTNLPVLATTLCLTPFFISKRETEGAAISAVISYLFACLLLVYQFRRFVGGTLPGSHSVRKEMQLFFGKLFQKYESD